MSGLTFTLMGFVMLVTTLLLFLIYHLKKEKRESEKRWLIFYTIANKDKEFLEEIDPKPGYFKYFEEEIIALKDKRLSEILGLVAFPIHFYANNEFWRSFIENAMIEWKIQIEKRNKNE